MARLMPTIKYVCGECGLQYDSVVEQCCGCRALLEVDNDNSLQQLKEAIALLKRCYPMLVGNNILSDVHEFIDATASI